VKVQNRLVLSYPQIVTEKIRTTVTLLCASLQTACSSLHQINNSDWKHKIEPLLCYMERGRQWISIYLPVQWTVLATGTTAALSLLFLWMQANTLKVAQGLRVALRNTGCFPQRSCAYKSAFFFSNAFGTRLLVCFLCVLYSVMKKWQWYYFGNVKSNVRNSESNVAAMW